MDKLTSYCDECGRPKGETNHWWVIWSNVKTKSLLLFPLEGANEINIPENFIMMKACGLECLAKLESKIKDGVNPLK